MFSSSQNKIYAFKICLNYKTLRFDFNQLIGLNATRKI